MYIERRNNIVYFNNDDGIAYGYLVSVDGGYRMAFYAGFVISNSELREVSNEIMMLVKTISS